jgi:hypothetical protein
MQEHEERTNENSRRYFVKVIAPDRRSLVALQKFELDVFQSTARAIEKDQHAIDGLLDLDEIGRVVDAGYSVLVEEHESKRSRAVTEISDFRSWIQEMEV